MLSCLVSFVLSFSRKPKGEEIHSWLHHGWSRYMAGADGGIAGDEAAAEADPEQLFFFGDDIIPSATNTLPFANWKTPANIKWLTEKATAAQDAREQHEDAARCLVASGYISWPEDGHDVRKQTSDVCVHALSLAVLRLLPASCVTPMHP